MEFLKYGKVRSQKPKTIVSFCYNNTLFSVCFVRYLMLWDF